MTIQQICQLSEEARTGELLEAVFIDQAIKDPDSKEADAGFVLGATYPTIPLRGLVELMAQKLSGEHPKGTVVIRGDYGRGKSHALLALYHVASLGSEAQRWLDEWNVHGRFSEHVNVALVQLVSENPDTFWELLFERAGSLRDYEAPAVEQRFFAFGEAHAAIRGRYGWGSASPNDSCTAHGGLSFVECLVPVLRLWHR